MSRWFPFSRFRLRVVTIWCLPGPQSRTIKRAVPKTAVAKSLRSRPSVYTWKVYTWKPAKLQPVRVVTIWCLPQSRSSVRVPKTAVAKRSRPSPSRPPSPSSTITVLYLTGAHARQGPPSEPVYPELQRQSVSSSLPVCESVIEQASDPWMGLYRPSSHHSHGPLSGVWSQRHSSESKTGRRC